jgi:hypothetical protein
MKTRGEHNGQAIQIFPMSRNQCVWMKTGVVNFKTCENAFDCTSCDFDKGISRIPARTPPVNWREAMQQSHLHKECRHMLTGRVLYKLCSHNFECKDCAYDQQLYEYDQVLGEEDLTAPAAALVNEAAGLMVANA